MIPFWKYTNNEDILNRLAIKSLFTDHHLSMEAREVSNDDAIEISISY